MLISFLVNRATLIYMNYTNLYKFETGGYIGLFLGYALLQTPDLCYKVFEWLKETFKVKARHSRANVNTGTIIDVQEGSGDDYDSSQL